MEKIYIPSDMFLDIDHGLCRFITVVANQLYDPDRINIILEKRNIPCPIEEFIMKYPIFKLNGLTSNSYNWLMDNYGDKVIGLSPMNEVIGSIVSTSCFSALSSEVQFVIGCSYNEEIDIIRTITRRSPEAAILIRPDTEINLNEFDTIFVKVLNDDLMKRFSDEKVSMKKIYVADYNFNTVVDDNGTRSIPLEYMAELEKFGNVVYTIQMYKDKGGK